MQVWSRDRIISILIRTKSPRQPNLIIMQPISQKCRLYPIRTSLPSCIQLPETESKSFEIKPQFINSLPHYHGLESKDSYFFIREFEEDTVRLRFVPLVLKDLAKK